jgi:hypothetical protein
VTGEPACSGDAGRVEPATGRATGVCPGMAAGLAPGARAAAEAEADGAAERRLGLVAGEDGGLATGRGVGFTVEGGGVVEAAGAPAPEVAWPAGSCIINPLIRSTVDSSRLARALTLTSSPHFWMRSSSSWLFNPSSFANS